VTDKQTIRKPPRKLKFYHILIIILCVILASYLLFRYKLKSRLQARLNEIRAAGYPVTCQELDEWYSIPELADNAASVIIDAFGYYRQWQGERCERLPIVGRAKLPPRTQPLTDETKNLIAQYLADNQKALELLHKGAKIEHSRYPVDFSRGFEAVMPYLSDIRQGVRLLYLEAILHAENNEPELAIQSIESMLGVARSLSEEPTLVSQLVNITCKALAVQALEGVINRTELTDAQLGHLSKIFTGAEDTSTMSVAFIGERCLGIAAFNTPAFKLRDWFYSTSSSTESFISAVIIALYKLVGLAEVDKIIYLDLMSESMKAYQLPLPQRQKAFKAVEGKIYGLSKIHFLLHIIMPAMSQLVMLDLRHIAELRAAQGAVTIQRYRLATGNRPDTLADLVPDYLDTVLSDPFDGNDLRYKKLDTGFVVYSIGEDGKDDGGKEKTPETERSNFDLTFIVER
jgi:hypothetical protein